MSLIQFVKYVMVMMKDAVAMLFQLAPIVSRNNIINATEQIF